MTDTTDIKALREASEIGESSDYMTWPKVDPAKLKRVLDQLEAERQRADESQAGFWGRTAARETIRANKAESELAALKGDQVPVVHPDQKRMDWLVSQYVEVRTPMFYGSHARFVAQCDSDDCEEHHTTLREQVDAAIEAAGGIVKDGE